MTQQADVSVNGGTSTHFNFANTFNWNQFWTVTIPVTLIQGTNTITFTASQQYNYDGTTVGVIYSGSGIGAALRSSSPRISTRSPSRHSRLATADVKPMTAAPRMRRILGAAVRACCRCERAH